MGKESRQMIGKMSFGIIGYEVILGIVTWFYARYTGHVYGGILAGILIGSAAVYGMLIDICMVSEDTLHSREEAYAKRTVTIHSMARKLAVFILMMVCLKSGYINVLSMILSLFGLKTGAFLVPFIESRTGKKS